MAMDPITAPDAIQPASLNFEALHEKAMAFEPAAASPPASDATPDSAPAPAPVPASADSTPAAPALTPAEQKVLDLPDDGMVRVKVDGKDELLPVSEFKSGISREAHYTQRMQQLAEQRKQAEAELASYYAQVQQQAQAVELAQQQLQQWAQQMQAGPAQDAPKPPDPGELATVGDVQSYVQQLDANLRQHYEAREQQLMQTLSQATQQAQEQAAIQRDALTYTQGLKQVLSHPDYKLLTDIVPFAEESIRFQVAQMDPPTIEDAVRYTEQVAKEWSQKLQGVTLEQQKRQQVAQARAKLEPPAGSPPAPTSAAKPGSFFRKDGKLDWDALNARAYAMMG